MSQARPADFSKLEPRIAEIGGELLKLARRYQHGKLSAAFWSDKLMGWAMSDPAFKVELFRFVDVFPALRSPEAVHRHLQEYLLRPGVATPKGLKTGLQAGGFLKGTLAKTVAGQIEAMGRTFIAGEDAAAALPKLRKRWDEGIAFSVDLLGEACLSEAEADDYRQRYLDLIQTLPGEVAGWPETARLIRDHLGELPRPNVSIKITSLAAKVEPTDFEGSIERVMAGIEPILDAAQRNNAFINFDMEHHALKGLTLAVFERCAERFSGPMGIALQAYLRSGEDDAQRLIDWSKRTGRRVTVRLVKGAYWDYEVIHAQQHGWPTPVWPTKAQTDACFERMAAMLLDATPRKPGEGGITLALGSHNVRSIASALAVLEQAGLPAEALELQMLYGMAEPLKRMAVARGLRLREYVPVGQMIPGMAYLVRRLLENTSNESWLRHGFLEQQDDAELLASPHHEPGAADTQAPPGVETRAAENHAVPEGFANEPHRDFADHAQREAFAAAVAAAQVPQVDQQSTVDDAVQAVARAAEALPAWRDTPAAQRIDLLRAAADQMRQQRDELAALVLREAGKPWADADGDVCEAIDFITYYAAQAQRLFTSHPLLNVPGESNVLTYEPRGVAVVISPWNFPLAICCGMTSAALLTGNPVIVKPAEQTPAIAQRMCRIMGDVFRGAGVPGDVLQCLPGRGETVGAALVRDPRVAVLAFTGSRAVGLDIVQAAGHMPDGQRHVKRVIAEMGGKNAIIVDDSADLDEAVAAVVRSAFGYAGQKCSACSRAIVLDAVHDRFVERLVEAGRAQIVGDAADPATDVPPLIDDEAAEKVRGYIDVARGEGQETLAVPGEGRLVGPHIYTGITLEHRLAREEVFGPVLAVMRAGDFDEALAMANASEYKLTGGVLSRTPSHLEQARRRFRVGNLYLNRGITGSLVGRQPFGGFGLSGVGGKTGGPDYLRQFVVSRATTENTMRRGFSPEVST